MAAMTRGFGERQAQEDTNAMNDLGIDFEILLVEMSGNSNGWRGSRARTKRMAETWGTNTGAGTALDGPGRVAATRPGR